MRKVHFYSLVLLTLLSLSGCTEDTKRKAKQALPALVRLHPSSSTTVSVKNKGAYRT